MVFNKDNKKEISAIEDLIKSKVYVNPKRFQELSNLKDDIWSRTLEVTGDPFSLLCFNLSPMVEECIRNTAGYTLQVEQISENPADPTYKEDRTRLLKVFRCKNLQEGRIVAIVHELSGQDDQLTLLDRRIIALSLLNKLPVLLLTTRGPHVLPAASAATGDTWPVFFVPHPQDDMRPVCQWLQEELPRVRALSAMIEADLQARVAHLGRVNAPLHFLSRASVALVPFGVMTVNFLGILRLMANMLQCVGMRGDTSANKALGLLGAKNAALVTSIDSMGDVYSFGVFATVLADLQGLGLVEAAAVMDVLDGLMLGSISVVTGAVSALGAYLSRPVVVRAAAEFLASLQTIYVLNPGMRRESERRPRGAGSKGTRKKGMTGRKGRKEGVQEEAEDLRGFLQRSKQISSVIDGAATRAEVGDSALASRRDSRPDALREEGREAEAEGVMRGDESDSSGFNSDEDTEEEPGDSSEEEREEVEGGDEELGACLPARAELCGGAGSAAVGKAGSEAVQVDMQAANAWASTAVLPSEAVETASCDGRAVDGRHLVPGTRAPKLSRTEKKQQALTNKQAAREAKAAKAAVKATAKAEKAAARQAERERKRLVKQQIREQKAADKAAAKGGKARGYVQLDATARVEQDLRDSSGIGDIGVSDTTAVMMTGSEAVKATWRQRRKAAASLVKATKAEMEASTSEEAGPRELHGADEAAGVYERSQSSSGGSSGAGSERSVAGEENLKERVEAALSREARLGLNEETCRGLMEFLALPDEEVFDQPIAQPQGGSKMDGLIRV